MRILNEEQAYFPIKNIDKFVELFENHLARATENDSEPNLAFLSILIGYLEYKLTLIKNADRQSSSTESDLDSAASQKSTSKDVSKPLTTQSEGDADRHEEDDFPVLEFDVVEALYLKFSILLKGLVDKTSTENTTRSGHATKELCKKVSDILWNRLNPHYHKDKAHIQSLFSFLTGRQLDCFGLAFVVIASCQILKYDDVHLVLSEDHAWAAHGDPTKPEMTEITWHGKGTEDKRGWSVKETDTEKSWMYLNGSGIICTRMMEVAAMVVAINPAIDSHSDSETMCDVQLRLLKLMLRLGALDRYPMALGFLAELEESSDLHKKAVKSVETNYNNSHVFPYCSQGQFYFRHSEYKKAIKCWSQAAQVLSKYNYTREDEEIYKEIMDIAGEMIPMAMKNDQSICDDKDCFLDLIRFYDGICLWEEDSSTPVLHSWWAKYFTQTLGRFPSDVRESFKEKDEEDNDDRSTGRRSRRLSLRSEESITETENEQQNSILNVKSSKMKGLEDLLIGSKKFNAQTVSLQLTAQSQVHLTKRKLNSGEVTTEYSGRIKKPKKFFE